MHKQIARLAHTEFIASASMMFLGTWAADATGTTVSKIELAGAESQKKAAKFG